MNGLGIGIGIVTTSIVSFYFCFPYIQTKLNTILLTSSKTTSNKLIHDEIIQKKLEEKLVILLQKDSVKQQFKESFLSLLNQESVQKSLKNLVCETLKDESVKESLDKLVSDTLQNESHHFLFKEAIKNSIYKFFN